jgi:hypothetical protein
MHLSQPLFVVLLCPLWALHAQDTPEPQTGAEKSDSARILAVSPGSEVELREGQKVQFDVTIHYSLNSKDIAILQVFAERYADGNSPCDDAAVHQTEGGTTALIRRGEGDVKLRFAWIEGSGPDAKVPRGASSLAFGMNLWTEKHTRPVKPMLQAFGTSSCRQIKP